MRRRHFVKLAVGASGVCGVTLAGCGIGSSSGRRVTLQLVVGDYGLPGDGNSTLRYWNWLIDGFEAQQPDIRVEVTVYPFTTLEDEVSELVQAGRAPDLAQSAHFADYGTRGLLYNAGDVLPIPVRANFPAQLVEAGELRRGRVQYGLPFVASARLFFYNRTLFAQAGLDPDRPPATWEELQQAALALRDAGVPVPYGLPLGSEEAQCEALIWMLSNGGGYVDDVGGYVIDSARNLQTFTWLRDKLVGRGLTQPNPAHTNRTEVFGRFVRGEVGMLNGHPTLIGQADAALLDYGIAPVPGNTGASRSAMGVADWLVAFQANGHREEVTTFLEFVYRTRYVRAFAERYQLLPVTIDGAAWMRGERKHRKLWPFLDELESAVFPPVSKASWGATSDRVRQRVGAAVTQGGDPETVLSDLQRDAVAEDHATR